MHTAAIACDDNGGSIATKAVCGTSPHTQSSYTIVKLGALSLLAHIRTLSLPVRSLASQLDSSVLGLICSTPSAQSASQLKGTADDLTNFSAELFCFTFSQV